MSTELDRLDAKFDRLAVALEDCLGPRHFKTLEKLATAHGQDPAGLAVHMIDHMVERVKSGKTRLTNYSDQLGKGV